MGVLGIEGTAWAASAAFYDPAVDDCFDSGGAVDWSQRGTDVADAPRAAAGDAAPGADPFVLETDAYAPDDGGIDPRESADHMADALPRVIGRVLDELAGRSVGSGSGTSSSGSSGSGTSGSGTSGSGPSSNRSAEELPIDAVAFSQGPGLGPCLRVAGTAARALAHRLDVPLVGVNHMVAHLEVGRHGSGFESPVCLNASGANAHLLGYRGGRYRVLGETMDTGVGNALDKVARHAGLGHPGGPKLEAAAADGELRELPYVVKGMDFSFAGIVTAAQELLDDGVPLADVAYSLQETIFAMLAEVAERALALTGSDELVLGGGVGQNERLREMLAATCEERGAAFHAPEPRFLRDNAAMIALLGAKQFAAGDVLELADSAVRPDYRPDEVPVTWRGDEAVTVASPEERTRRGAEAVVDVGPEHAVKRRLPKPYRHTELDERLRAKRTRSEARLASRARRAGVPAPVVLDVDLRSATLVCSSVGDRDLRAVATPERLRRVGEHLATLHGAGIVHGDPTTRNVRVDLPDATGASEGDGADGDSPAADDDDGHSPAADGDDDSPAPDGTSDGGSLAGEDEPGAVSLIDFGLGYDSGHVEDRAMDLHVLEQSLLGSADDADALIEALEAGYAAEGNASVLDRLREVEGRGRYQ